MQDVISVLIFIFFAIVIILCDDYARTIEELKERIDTIETRMSYKK